MNSRKCNAERFNYFFSFLIFFFLTLLVEFSLRASFSNRCFTCFFMLCQSKMNVKDKKKWEKPNDRVSEKATEKIILSICFWVNNCIFSEANSALIERETKNLNENKIESAFCHFFIYLSFHAECDHDPMHWCNPICSFSSLRWCSLRANKHECKFDFDLSIFFFHLIDALKCCWKIELNRFLETQKKYQFRPTINCRPTQSLGFQFKHAPIPLRIWHIAPKISNWATCRLHFNDFRLLIFFTVSFE